MNMRHAARLCLAAIVSLTSLMFTVSADARATYVKFEAPGALSTSAYFINSNGDVAGEWYNRTEGGGYVRTPDGTVSDIDPPGFDHTVLQVGGLNDNGLVVGSYNVSGEQPEYEHGFLRTPDGSIAKYDVPGGLFGSTRISAVNNKGMIVGSYCDNSGACPAFLFTRKGKLKSFNIDAALCGLDPVAINDSGVIIGFYYDSNCQQNVFPRSLDGTVTTIAPQGADKTFVYAINSKNVILGKYRDASNQGHLFVATPDGTVSPIEGPSGAVDVFPRSINDKGVIVGMYVDSAQQYHGFIRSRHGHFKSWDFRRSTGIDANGVNDLGYVAGEYADKNGNEHAYIRIP